NRARRGALFVEIRIILIEDPFDDVTVDVVQAPRIGLLLAHLLIFEIAVLLVPGVFAKLARVVAEEMRTSRSGAAGVFPFRLGGQPVKLAGLRAEPLAVLVCAVLRHADGG